MKKLIEYTKILRSKNAGPLFITFDLIFNAKEDMDYVKENDMEITVPNKKIPDGDDWSLVDIGPVVVHLMTEEARNFYDLEKLWQAGEKLM